MKVFGFFLLFVSMLAAQNHILITEVVVQPTPAEFIEIHNPTQNTIDLSDYYLTDATFAGGDVYYYNIVTGNNAGGGGFSDFHARFPAGSQIGAGEFQTIAMNGSDFITTYATNPTYELFETNASIPNMREALSGSINDQGGLTNGGEVVILYFWDGQSDLVSDIDYYLWGDKAEAVDKTGVSIDGPDQDSNPSTYLDDTPIASQAVASNGEPHAPGESSQRTNLVESGETASGGNGITGHNETSENLGTSFSAATPNPGSGPGGGNGNQPPAITNIMREPSNPGPSDQVTVSADVTDDSQVISVQLIVSIDGGEYTQNIMNNTGADRYQAQIDSQSVGTQVKYYIMAQDDSSANSQTDTLSYTVTEPQGVIPIADIRNNPGYIGQTVTVEGVITVGSGILTSSWTDTYIQDNSGRGINVYRGGTPVDPDLVRGNLMRIEGTVEEFSGILEIVDYTATIISTNQPLPDALEISTQQATGTELEGTLVKVTGVITDLFTAGPGTNILVDDGSGEATVRAWDTAQITLDDFSTGDTVAVTGVLDIFNSAGQLLLAYQGDIEKSSLGPGDEELVITQVTANPASPTSSDPVVIETEIFAKNTITSIQLFTSFNSSPFDSTEMTLVSETTYQAVIDSQAAGTVVRYYVKVEDNLGNAVSSTQTSYTVSQPVTITPIADIRSNPDFIGQTVTVEAVVTIGSGLLTTNWTDVYVQDNSGRGINVYRGGSPDPSFQRGYLVRVRGEVEEFDGVLEIVDYNVDILAENQPLPDAAQLTTDEATDVSWEGTFIVIKGVILELFSAGGGTNIVIDDGSGEVTVRVWDTAGLDLSAYAVGDNIEVKGVVDIYQGSGQVLLAYQEDIGITEIPKSPLLLQVPNKPFVPDQGETLEITYSAGTENARVTIRIYDLSGRLIATPVDEAARSFEQTFEWDGTDQVNEQVTLGAYILVFEVVSSSDGSTSVKTAPIVVGTILKK